MNHTANFQTAKSDYVIESNGNGTGMISCYYGCFRKASWNVENHRIVKTWFRDKKKIHLPSGVLRMVR